MFVLVFLLTPWCLHLDHYGKKKVHINSETAILHGALLKIYTSCITVTPFLWSAAALLQAFPFIAFLLSFRGKKENKNFKKEFISSRYEGNLLVFVKRRCLIEWYEVSILICLAFEVLSDLPWAQKKRAYVRWIFIIKFFT